VNKNHKTLVIQYDEKCISSASDAFQDFPLHDENEETINNYQIKHLIEHHEIYNIHLEEWTCLSFFEEHKKYFPTLLIIVQLEAARRVVEVGCERFFGLSGYISSPRCSRLGVRTYKHVAMLASIIQSVYIDNKWVAQQYIERCKKGSWKKENTEEALKCWNLECIIDAEQQGKESPSELTLEDILNEEGGRASDNAKDGERITVID
jgi:hypothetical protein